MSALLGWFSAQILKVFTDMYKGNKFNFSTFLFSSGGMPSSHSATVTALCTSSVIVYGFGSFEFAVTAILAIIVMIDAMGVRRETGKQSVIINQMIKELFEGKLTDVDARLKEIVGHSPLQVFAGFLLGVVQTFVLKFIML
jgi:acid phosphatase family membrane protein YuiD